MRLFFAALVFAVISIAAAWPAHAQDQCSSGACVSAGPRLASLDTTQSALLNPLIQALLPGTAVNLSVLDWNALAGADINLNLLLTQLGTNLGLSDPAQVLAADIGLGDLQLAMVQVLQADGQTAAANALQLLPLNIPGLAGTIRLGDLLQIALPQGSLADINLDLLDLVTGAVQLYNFENVLTTPQPITVDTGAIGLTGLANLQLWVQVVEPPVYVCGPDGTQFYTSAIRIKLNVEVVSGFDLQPILDALNALGLGIANITLTQDVLTLQMYIDVARAEGTITMVDVVNQAVGFNARPGLANVYLGEIADSVFFNRSQVITPAILQRVQLSTMELGFSANVILVGTVDVTVPLTVYARAVADGTPELIPFTLSGPFPQTVTAASGTVSAGAMVTSLLQTLDLDVEGGVPEASVGGVSIPLPAILGPIVDTLVSTVESTLQATASTVLEPAFSLLLGSLIDPLLGLLGVQIGQAVFTVEGIAQSCAVALVLAKVLDPPADSGLFNLDISQGGSVLASAVDVGNGGATTPVITTPGATYDLAEAAGTGSDLARYAITWACTDGDGNPVSDGTGPSFSVVAPDLTPEPVTVTCRITNRARQANLSISKSDASGSYIPGASATYVITVNNAGPDAVVGAVITDVLPNGVTLRVPWSCTATAGTCTPASGGSTGDQTVTLAVDLDAGGQAQVSVQIDFDDDPASYP